MRFASSCILAGDVSAVAARCRCRRAAVLHPDPRGVRDPRSPGRLQFADDRPDAVAGILYQQGLAGRLRRRHRAVVPPPCPASAVRPSATPATGDVTMIEQVTGLVAERDV